MTIGELIVCLSRYDLNTEIVVVEVDGLTWESVTGADGMTGSRGEFVVGLRCDGD